MHVSDDGINVAIGAEPSRFGDGETYELLQLEYSSISGCWLLNYLAIIQLC